MKLYKLSVGNHNGAGRTYKPSQAQLSQIEMGKRAEANSCLCTARTDVTGFVYFVEEYGYTRIGAACSYKRLWNRLSEAQARSIHQIQVRLIHGGEALEKELHRALAPFRAPSVASFHGGKPIQLDWFKTHAVNERIRLTDGICEGCRIPTQQLLWTDLHY